MMQMIRLTCDWRLSESKTSSHFRKRPGEEDIADVLIIIVKLIKSNEQIDNPMLNAQFMNCVILQSVHNHTSVLCM